MNRELVFVLEPDAGRVTVEISKTPVDATVELANDLGGRVNLNCGKPAKNINHLPVLNTLHTPSLRTGMSESSIWLHRLYHNSVVDGPGRRSVVQVAGCSIRCAGCYVPETHDRGNGELISISLIVEEIISRRDEIDGVTVLGGEPFDQASSVAELVSRLKNQDFHVAIYTGNTVDQLIGRCDPCVSYILTHIDLLIDGPFKSSLVDGAGEYRGSSNQRLLQQNSLRAPSF